ncbi:MAG: taurine transporter [Noviherbaspirillum sp.]|nr:taurine transporter [Noviherbaspirillum sp.]
MTAAPARRPAGASAASRVTLIRSLTVAIIWVAWEVLARSGWLYEGVIPSSLAVLASVWKHLNDPVFYRHIERTFYEVIAGMSIGTALGLMFGIFIGRSRFFGRVLEIYVNVLAPAPKIVFLPLLMVIFGVDFGSKVAMGAASAFFPVAVATLSAIQLVNPVLIRVAQSFNATVWQLVSKVYLPAMIEPLVSGMRLGLGVAIIGVLLAEIKLSNIGLGHLAIQHYNQFKIADMYAVLLITFALAVGANSLIGALARRVQRR